MAVSSGRNWSVVNVPWNVFAFDFQPTTLPRLFPFSSISVSNRGDAGRRVATTWKQREQKSSPRPRAVNSPGVVHFIFHRKTIVTLDIFETDIFRYLFFNRILINSLPRNDYNLKKNDKNNSGWIIFEGR